MNLRNWLRAMALGLACACCGATHAQSDENVIKIGVSRYDPHSKTNQRHRRAARRRRGSRRRDDGDRRL
jgi:hypothetical protein